MTPELSPDEKFPLNSTLQPLMQKAGFSSWTALSRASGVSLKQLRRLRQGQLAELRVGTIVKLAHALNSSAPELLTLFAGLPDRVSQLQQEYQRSQTQLQEQPQQLEEQFHRQSLEQLESWLRYWPIAVAKVQQDAIVKPINLVKLVKPVEQLIESWGVEAIASIGDRIPYNPQWHQLTQGQADPETLVTVTAPGYRYRQKLLFRAEVKSTQ